MKKRGFTLVELMVVITIIAVLSGIVVVSLAGSKANSRDAKRISDIKNIQLALSQYYADTNHYPPSISALAPLYIPAEPKDPSNDSSYYYAGLTVGSITSTCNAATRYHLGALLETNNAGSKVVLNEDYDSDENPIKIPKTTGQQFNSCGATIEFMGNSTNCIDFAATGDQCYDLIN